MADQRLKNLADILVNFSTRVQPGDWVHIESGFLAIPLLREIIASVLAAGGHATTSLTSRDLAEVYLNNASDEQLQWNSPLRMHSIKDADVAIFISAPENSHALSGIPSDRIQISQQAGRPWADIYWDRSESGALRWVMTNYPCQALAQDADMSLAEYEDFVFSATFADQSNPREKWEEIKQNQARLIEWLEGKNTITIRGVNADLSLSIEGRPFINAFGDQNMPSGEIFTSPVKESVEGWVEFTYPAIHLGREVEGIRLEFEKGKVVRATAQKNEEYLHKMLDLDEGARYLGELGIGTNFGIKHFSKDILFDEKIGGTFHLAIGRAFPEAGGTNDSNIHWDLICDAQEDTEFHVDGELFYRNGKFQI
jgi:aminopeptidase